jgi:hypothetical protein
MTVVDGTSKFTCSHQFVGLPVGFRCINCDHFREELTLDGKKSILFFPVPRVTEDMLDLSSLKIVLS